MRPGTSEERWGGVLPRSRAEDGLATGVLCCERGNIMHEASYKQQWASLCVFLIWDRKSAC
jgi:hypothetical protein